jgi:hypothetical protein
MRRRRGCNGLTLPELLIAATLLLLIMGMAWMLMVSGQHTWSQGDAMVAATDQLRQSLDRLSSGLRQVRAADLVRPNPPNTNLAALAGDVTVFLTSVNGAPVRFRLRAQPNGLKTLAQDVGDDGTDDAVIARDLAVFLYACPAQPTCPDNTTPAPTSLLAITIAATQQAALFGGGQRPVASQMTTQVALQRNL